MKLASSTSAYLRRIRDAALTTFTRLFLVSIDAGDSALKSAVFTKGGEAQDVRDRTNGQVAVPSIIVVKKDEVLTGFAAENAAKLYPDRVIRDWKSALGTDEVVVTIDGIPRTALWCVTQVMRDALASAAIRLGAQPNAVVLTHKGNAPQAHLKDIVTAAESLGVKVKALVAESTAAVYGYDAFDSGKRYVAVSDWGSSTHDITILDVTNPECFRVVAVLGTPAGGSRVTNALIERCIDGFATQLGFLPTQESSPLALLELREQCEQAKLSFAVCDTALVVVRDGTKTFQQEFTVDEFLACLEPVEAEVFAAIDSVLADTGISPSQVHWVGAGRGTRARGYIERFEQRYGTLHCDLDIDTAISRGALWFAAKHLSEQGHASRFANLPSASELASLEDVNHRAFGIMVHHWIEPRRKPIPLQASDVDPTECREGLDAILNRWEPLGDEKARTYSPCFREESRVLIRIVEGPKDRADPEDCTELGSFSLDLVPAAGRDCVGRIEVCVKVDSESKLVTVIARDLYGPDDQESSGTVQWDPAPRPTARVPQLA